MTRRKSGFTLIEVVLAIGLTAVIVYLLTTAMELYLANVDASRTRVETAQLARTLLDQIAGDLANARLAAPAARPGGGSGGFNTSMGGAGPNGQAPGGGAPAGGGTNGGSTMGGGTTGGGVTGGGAPPAIPGSVQGLFGTTQQLRIDRAAYANWERASREIDVQEAATRADMPITVRYFFVKDNRITTQRLAQQGVARPYSAATAAGLYRETIPTAALLPDDPPLPTADSVRSGAQADLLAPEVVAFEVAYYNGMELVEEWDPALDGGLPRGVEIRLTIAQPRFQARPSEEEQQRLAEGRYRESELIQFRRFVRLPLVAASPPAQMLLPAGGQQGGGPFGGQGGQGQGGGGQGGNGGGGGGQGGNGSQGGQQ